MQLWGILCIIRLSYIFTIYERMKKILISLIVLSSLFTWASAQTQAPDSSENILTEKFEQVLEADDIEDPLRDGAYGIVGGDNVDPDKKISSILEAGEITEHKTAMDSTLNFIKKIVNYLLWFLWLIALLFMIYHWFLMLTAAGDDAQYKKWLKSIKYAAIAIWWVWISWLFVSFIFWLISKFIW